MLCGSLQHGRQAPPWSRDGDAIILFVCLPRSKLKEVCSTVSVDQPGLLTDMTGLTPIARHQGTPGLLCGAPLNR